MATLSSLRTRLTNRLGITTVSTAESARLDECLNAAISRLVAEDLPGFSYEFFSAEIPAALTLTDGATTVASSVLTSAASSFLTGAGAVYPGDQVVIGTTTHFVRRALTATTLDLGGQFQATATGLSATINRKHLVLPSHGAIIAVHRSASRERLIPLSPTNAYEAVQNSAGRFYTVGKDHLSTRGATFVSIWPAPAAGTRYIIQMNEALNVLAAGDDLPLAEPMLDALLERARHLWLTYVGELNPSTISTGREALTDVNTALRTTSVSVQPIKK